MQYLSKFDLAHKHLNSSQILFLSDGCAKIDMLNKYYIKTSVDLTDTQPTSANFSLPNRPLPAYSELLRLRWCNVELLPR